MKKRLDGLRKKGEKVRRENIRKEQRNKEVWREGRVWAMSQNEKWVLEGQKKWERGSTC